MNRYENLFHSIRFRLICTVSTLLVGAFCVCWLANQLFLPKYYEYEKCNALKDTYSEVYDKMTQLEKEGISLEQGQISEEEQTEDETKREMVEAVKLSFEKISADNNVGIYVVDYYTLYLRSAFDFALGAEHKRGDREEAHNYVGAFIYSSENKHYMSEEENRQIYEQLDKYFGNYAGVGGAKVRSTVLYHDKEKGYAIVKVHDERLDSDYIELVGAVALGDGTPIIYLRSNYESIQESVKLSSRFMIYVALFSVLVGVMLMLAISDSFTRPIVKLSKIAREMSELKFETKYTESRQDEIGELGHSINQLSEKLEHTISELKTANNELQSDIQNKIQVDEMRKEFLSNVTHELKTPIALIQGYAEGLKDNITEDEESKEFYCEVIIDEANKMNKMVKNLLNLNQIEFGKNQVEFERFDIVEVIRSVLDSNRIVFEQKNVSLQFEPAESVYVWADEYMVQEVVTNYVTNALNHVDGAKRIDLSLERRERIVRVSVGNTGEPIPESELDKVWIKFYKVDKARTREYGGSGIGLSIVKAIMKSMNQECGVFNREDGVVFWFELDIQD